MKLLSLYEGLENTHFIIEIRGTTSIHQNITTGKIVGKNTQVKRDARVRNPRRHLIGSILGIFSSKSSMGTISSTITGSGSQALKPGMLLIFSPGRKVKTGLNTYVFLDNRIFS
jgi:hypothetical protein